MWSETTAIWGIAGLATLGVIARPWNLPEYIWAVAGAVLLVACGRGAARRRPPEKASMSISFWSA